MQAPPKSEVSSPESSPPSPSSNFRPPPSLFDSLTYPEQVLRVHRRRLRSHDPSSSSPLREPLSDPERLLREEGQGLRNWRQSAEPSSSNPREPIPEQESMDENGQARVEADAVAAGGGAGNNGEVVGGLPRVELPHSNPSVHGSKIGEWIIPDRPPEQYQNAGVGISMQDLDEEARRENLAEEARLAEMESREYKQLRQEQEAVHGERERQEQVVRAAAEEDR